MKFTGNAKRRHGYTYYAGKYAARIGGAIAGKALFGKPNLWGYKRGGRWYKRLLGGVSKSQRRSIGSHRFSSNRSKRRVGTNPSRRTGTNPPSRKPPTGSNPGPIFRPNKPRAIGGYMITPWQKVRKARKSYYRY